jgi:hypothetical protein
VLQGRLHRPTGDRPMMSSRRAARPPGPAPQRGQTTLLLLLASGPIDHLGRPPRLRFLLRAAAAVAVAFGEEGRVEVGGGTQAEAELEWTTGKIKWSWRK